MANPILVTGAAGRVGAVGRTLTELLLKQGQTVRAMVRKEDERAQALRDMGAQVVAGDLLDLDSLHRVIAGCDRMYFGMSVSDAYLAATVNAAAVARHYGVKAFINMSQMTISQMSITETTPSPQHKLHWLAEQALNWSGLPVVHVRPTVLLEGFFLIFTADSVSESNQIRLPFGEGKTSPVAVEDVARVLAALLVNPQPHIGRIYHLTGPQSENMHFFAQEYSKALGRTIAYQDIPVEPWRDALLQRGLPVHLVNHVATMADLHRAGRYDRMSDDVRTLTGKAPVTVQEFVRRNAATFTSSQKRRFCERATPAEGDNRTQTTLYNTHNDLSEDVRSKAIGLLNQHLAEILDLQSQTKQAHWNVKGPNFIALHELFDEVAGELEEFADEIAERAVALGGIAPGTVRVAAATSRLPEYPLEIVSGRDHVSALSAGLARFGKTARAAIDTAGNFGDLDTADLFTEVSRAIDKLLWKVEAHIQANE